MLQLRTHSLQILDQILPCIWSTKNQIHETEKKNDQESLFTTAPRAIQSPPRYDSRAKISNSPKQMEMQNGNSRTMLLLM